MVVVRCLSCCRCFRNPFLLFPRKGRPCPSSECSQRQVPEPLLWGHFCRAPWHWNRQEKFPVRRTPFPAPTDVQVCHQGPGGDRKSGPGHGSPRQAAAGLAAGRKEWGSPRRPPPGEQWHQFLLACTPELAAVRRVCAEHPCGCGQKLVPTQRKGENVRTHNDGCGHWLSEPVGVSWEREGREKGDRMPSWMRRAPAASEALGVWGRTPRAAKRGTAAAPCARREAPPQARASQAPHLS